MPSLLLAFISIFLWGSLAAIGQRLGQVPPFLLVGITLGIGSLPSLLNFRSWLARPGILLFGTAGIFGYHFLLFLSFKYAAVMEANLINYAWPILIILFSGILLPGQRLRLHHVLGGLIAFAGAALIISSAGGPLFGAQHLSRALVGYFLAFTAALIWAFYSVMTKRLPSFPTSMVGGFCFLSSLLALGCHFWFEPSVQLDATDWGLLGLLGVGPLGIAFYTWDAALKKGDPRLIGTLSYFTPVLSTYVLALSTGAPVSQTSVTALILIVGGALIGSGDKLYVLISTALSSA
jgi:drug/metabolite transporter (DMT)-like permease